MIEATVYILGPDGITDRTSAFNCKSSNFENYLTSLYGSDNMENIEWDIWEPPEEEGLEELETDVENDMCKFLKRKAKRNHKQ